MTASRTIAVAQISLSVVFLIGYFAMLALFITGNVATPVEWKDTLAALLSVLTAGVLTILGFWFNRSRTTVEPQA
jgi:uncharacterized membrane protein